MVLITATEVWISLALTLDNGAKVVRNRPFHSSAFFQGIFGSFLVTSNPSSSRVHDTRFIKPACTELLPSRDSAVPWDSLRGLF